MDYSELLTEERIHLSLRECLVTAETFVAQMANVESTQAIEDFAPIIYRNHYYMPYPYKLNFIAAYIMEKYHITERPAIESKIAEFDDEDRAAVLNLLHRRIDPFTKFAMGDDVVGLIDNDYDSGCVINTTNGAINPFKYNELDHIETIGIPNGLRASLIMQRSSVEGSLSEDDELNLKFLSKDPNILDSYYGIIFKGYPNVYYNNTDRVYGYLNGKPIPYQSFAFYGKYISDMLSRHAKVIILN